VTGRVPSYSDQSPWSNNARPDRTRKNGGSAGVADNDPKLTFQAHDLFAVRGHGLRNNHLFASEEKNLLSRSLCFQFILVFLSDWKNLSLCHFQTRTHSSTLINSSYTVLQGTSWLIVLTTSSLLALPLQGRWQGVNRVIAAVHTAFGSVTVSTAFRTLSYVRSTERLTTSSHQLRILSALGKCDPRLQDVVHTTHRQYLSLSRLA